MSKLPILETERLILRPLTLTDAPELQRLLNDWDIANTAERLPYPYEIGMAEE